MGDNEKILRIFFGGIKGHRGGYKCEIFDKIFIYNILFYVPPWKNAWKRMKKQKNKKSAHPNICECWYSTQTQTLIFTF